MNPDTPKIKIPPPLLFFLSLCVAGLLEYWLEFFNFESLRILRWIVAVLIFGFAGYLALHAVVVLKMSGTHIDPGQPTTTIVDSGPFRVSRNPMYLSLVLILLGLSIWFVSIWFLAATIFLLLVLDRTAVRPEENYLETKFGELYTSYKTRVRRWL